jgi:hypothetical protein
MDIKLKFILHQNSTFKLLRLVKRKAGYKDSNLSSNYLYADVELFVMFQHQDYQNLKNK